MLYRNIYGVPDFECTEYAGKTKDYVLLIPIIKELLSKDGVLTRASTSAVSGFMAT